MRITDISRTETGVQVCIFAWGEEQIIPPPFTPRWRAVATFLRDRVHGLKELTLTDIRIKCGEAQLSFKR